MTVVLPDVRSPRKPATGRRRNFTREQRIAHGAVVGSVAVASSGYALDKVSDAGLGGPVRLLLTLLLTVHARCPCCGADEPLGRLSPRQGSPFSYGRGCWEVVCCRRPSRTDSWAADWEVLLWLGLVFTTAWLMHLRRQRVPGRVDAALTGLLSSTRNMVHSERQRVAGGLREKVLQQTSPVTSSTEAGSPNEVATATRATLATMRQLLGGLDVGKQCPLPLGRPPHGAPRVRGSG